jgi:hypothetical protein
MRYISLSKLIWLTRDKVLPKLRNAARLEVEVGNLGNRRAEEEQELELQDLPYGSVEALSSVHVQEITVRL